MGVVDLARRPDGSLVALKRLAMHGTADEMKRARSRFQRELDVLRRLEHEAVVPLLDVLDDDGELILVMPYLSGGNLSERVRAGGPLSSDDVRTIAARLLPALAAAHRRGIVHRDIKPANVLFDEDGRAHLADFGVASTRDSTCGLTNTGVVLGTPGFLAPEQARGEPVTPASDIASLGCTLHFAATGASPYEGGETAAVLLRTARAKPDISRAIEPDLRRMIASMLDGRPDRRPTAAALAGGAEGTDKIPLHVPHNRVAVLLAAIVAAATVALAVTQLAGGDQTATTATSAAPTSSTSTEPPCQPLPYQPCGQPIAPNTDGRRCIDDHADYDGRTTNGCEAVPDDLDGTTLVDRLEANIVPADDLDRYPLRVSDEGDIGCNNTLRLTITAPAGTALRLELLDDDGEVVGETVSADGVTGELAVSDPRCFRNDAGDYTAVVTPSGSDRSAEPYVLTRSGSF